MKKIASVRKQKKNRPYVMPLSPPRLTTSIECFHTFRFVCEGTSGVANQLITTGNLLDLLVMAVTATATYSIIEAFKIKRVELWGPAQSQTGAPNGAGQFLPNSVSLEFNGSGAGNVGTKPNRVIDTPMGATRNACAFLKPPKTSAAADWQVNPESGSQTTGLGIIVSCPFGSIMDISMAFIIQNGSPPNAGPTIDASAGTIGQVYFAPVDGTSGNWSALGAPTYAV